MSWFDELFFPRRCPVCQDIVSPWGREVCDTCREKLRPETGRNCMKCGRMLMDDNKEYCEGCKNGRKKIIRGVVGYDYRQEWVHQMMLQVKYHNARQLLDAPCRETAMEYKEIVGGWGCECLVPVPLYFSRRRKRGFNQAEEIAERLSDIWEIQVDKKLLFRIKNTQPQKELTSMLRMSNLMSAFSADEKRACQYNTVILIDDIYTTGSTMEACAGILINAGIKNVYSFALTGVHDEA